MEFPLLRFAQAGATEQETERLNAAFDASSEEAQLTYLAHLDGVSNYDLALELIAGRGEEVEASEEEPEPDPTPPQGSAGLTEPDGEDKATGK